ncbi:MAG: hypothetical protein ACR2IP_12965 [Solirubrobacteraceae bacterium]
MDVADIRARVDAGLAGVRGPVNALAGYLPLPDVSGVDPKALVGGAFAAGIVLGKVVSRLAR